MEIPEHRKWIDNRCKPKRGGITPEFFAGLDNFIEVASAQESFLRLGGKLKCPCMKCECLRFKSVNEVKSDLCKHGFMKCYYYWTIHGEEVPVVSPRVGDNFRDRFSPFEQMVREGKLLNFPSKGPSSPPGRHKSRKEVEVDISRLERLHSFPSDLRGKRSQQKMKTKVVGSPEEDMEGSRGVTVAVPLAPKPAAIPEGVSQPKANRSLKEPIQKAKKVRTEDQVVDPSTEPAVEVLGGTNSRALDVAPISSVYVHPPTRKPEQIHKGPFGASSLVAPTLEPVVRQEPTAQQGSVSNLVVSGPFGDAIHTLARLWEEASAREAKLLAGASQIAKLEQEVKYCKEALKLAELDAKLANEAEARARADAEESAKGMLEVNVLNSSLGQEVDKLKKVNEELRKKVKGAKEIAEGAAKELEDILHESELKIQEAERKGCEAS